MDFERFWLWDVISEACECDLRECGMLIIVIDWLGVADVDETEGQFGCSVDRRLVNL